ncbi:MULTISPECIES: glycosyltransferase family 2 protein [Bacilli]|uniref:glycosyltransferase family 2 protein n=1 Tax=Bacilli TaxID=91061 RepID=UPI001DEA6B7E|nr:glycosyltransferase family 2 protein [Staphylococcus ureilyticus]HJG67480.1 glycosyltransferase [Staphylococcus ureilyticus]
METVFDELITVVIPIYNVERYVEQCLQSVINQTYKNLQIILVDDGSTDSSGEICDRFAAQDSRVQVIHQKNAGLSAARNVGIEFAKGEFISFIDSDDFVETNYIERLYTEIKAYNAQIAVCEYSRLDDEKKIFYFHTKEPYTKTITYTEYLDEIFKTLTLAFVTAWAKLYKIELFNGEFPIRFPEGKLAEDKYVTYLLALKSQNIVYLHEPNYCYRQRSGSITKSEASIKRAADDIEGCEKRLTDLVFIDYDIYKAIGWYEYILRVHKQILESANLTDNDVYAKIKKKVAIMDKKYH